ncbi:hypothetical protein FA13DRAFT_1742419 [Coprinellus micaceus]|uniref:Uncharacterized protein n=1 Tax=Coprinellus micaceus TaxID=71717 RepID=A0A4Y7SGS5_COPMI|nr:hypothetical protein FA13DRAFT_1742419 [Coprinellus micaceus]
MERILPKLLLDIFDLDRPHTKRDSILHFSQRLPIPTPNFPTGISAHAINKHSPLHFSHVCEDWRSLAFTESTLWSKIYVTNGRP